MRGRASSGGKRSAWRGSARTRRRGTCGWLGRLAAWPGKLTGRVGEPVLQGDANGKRRALVWRRLEIDLPAEEAREASRERETHAGPAIASRQRPIDLPEVVEDEPTGRGRNADAGVTHPIHGPVVLDVDRDGDGAIARELVRVVQQVDQDLRDFAAVAAYAGQHPCRLVDLGTRRGRRPTPRDGVAERLPGIERVGP